MSDHDTPAPVADRPLKLVQPLWAIIFRNTAPMEVVRQHREAHLKHQVELERAGVLFGAGPLAELDGTRVGRGLIIIRADSAEEAKRIADSDPMFAAGVRQYELHQWQIAEGNLRITLHISDGSHIVH